MKALGAACCGAGASVPGLLLDEERSRVTVGSRFVRLVGVSDDGGDFLKDDGWHDDTVTGSVEAATLVADRWSLGARFGLGRRSVPGVDGPEVASGAGDLTAVVAYEWLPEWNARSTLPRGVAFFAATAPTGAADPMSPTALGRGYWSFALGSSFAKTFGAVDWFAVPQVGLGFRQVAGLAGGEREATAAVTLGVGVTPAKWPLRLGLRVDPQARWPSGLPARYLVPVVAEASWMLGDTWRLAVAYEDQTIFPVHRNAALGQGVALTLVHRWLR